MKFVFPLLSYKKHGGVRVLSFLINGLAEKGHDVFIVVPEDAFEEFYKLDEKVKKILTPRRGRNPIGLLKTLFYLLVKSPPADYVVVSFFPTFFPALLHKILKGSKLIYYIQDLEHFFYPFPFSTLALLTYILPTDLTICASSWIRKKIRKGKVLSPPISEDFFESTEGLKKALNNVALVFRWDRRKRPGLARKILKDPRFDKFNFFVIGHDPIVRKKNIHFLGTLKNKELIEAYNGCTFFILTSKFEGFGLPPLEAMARGCIPFSFTNTGPMDYIEDGKNGFYVETEDELYSLMVGLLNSPKRINEMSERCISTATQFTKENFLAEFEKSLNSP
ncbi:MAG: glycosyltransferase family 4 protein [bacterium]|nr:glycosyltransferase family 4 protein [bacterium]